MYEFRKALWTVRPTYPISSVCDVASLESHHSAKGRDVQRMKEVRTEEPVMRLGFYELQTQRIFTKTSPLRVFFLAFLFPCSQNPLFHRNWITRPQFSSLVQAPWSPHAGHCICQCLVGYSFSLSVPGRAVFLLKKRYQPSSSFSLEKRKTPLT